LHELEIFFLMHVKDSWSTDLLVLKKGYKYKLAYNIKIPHIFRNMPLSNRVRIG